MVPVAGVWPAFPVPDDIHDSFHGLLVPGTMRDSLFLLQAVLEQVQNQRSEAKERLRDERTALAEARWRIATLESKNKELQSQIGKASAKELEAEKEARAKVSSARASALKHVCQSG